VRGINYMKIEKKIWHEYFEKVLNGSKTYELRLNDFVINEGDTLVLREWNPKTKEYTGRTIEKKVGFVGRWKLDVLTQFWSQKEIDDNGVQVISLKD